MKKKRKTEKSLLRTYEKPRIRTETMFETSALACGKCMSGPVGQYQCGSLLQNS